MTFKVHWEQKSMPYQIPDTLLEKMVLSAYPEASIIMYVVLSGGCANLNVKVQLANQAAPVLLRIYLRDPTAAMREQKLADLLYSELPVPLTHYVGMLEGYQFSITDFLPGVPLRELLLGPVPYDLGAVMFEVGEILAKIGKYSFEKLDFFDEPLRFGTDPCELDLLSFAMQCLEDKNIATYLQPEKRARIIFYLEKYQALLLTVNNRQLVHGDFDPGNVLVDNVTGEWKITGILDWEEAFSGSYLWDVANMLRYAHQMPERFENAFLQGLKKEGVILPVQWPIITQLLNMIALLDCLRGTHIKSCPKKCADIDALLNHVLLDLKIQEG